MDMKKILYLTLMVLLLAVGGASAAKIDFTDEGPAPALDFSQALGLSSFTIDISGVDLTFTPGPPDTVNPPSLWWDNIDGFGVQYSYEQDEIEGSEYLQLSFSTPFNLDNIYIADLFNENGYMEYGWYQLDGGQRKEIFAASDQDLGVPGDNGETVLNIGGIIVRDILFTAPGLIDVNGQLQNHEYAVQGISGSPVPLPPTILMLGSGILGLIGFSFRRTSKGKK
jgi:hypothetical protein